MMPILELERLGFKYGEKRVLRDVTLSVEKGEFFGILGPNGSGKSTLLNLIDGIRLPCEGEIRLKGIAPGKMQRRDVARLVAVVPQGASWVFPLKVEEVVLMGRTPHLGRLAFEKEMAVDRRQYQPAAFVLRPEIRFVGDAYLSGDNDNTGGKLSSYRIYDLFLFYRPVMGRYKISAFAGVQNLTNELYATSGVKGSAFSPQTYYPMPERAVKCGISFEF